MSLRLRLVLILGLSFAFLWLAAAAWLYGDLRQQMRETLDHRLAASARMVAGLVAQLPANAWEAGGPPVLSLPAGDGVACQIRAPEGRVLVRTHGALDGQLDTPDAGYADRIIDGQRWRLFTYVQNGTRITTADRMAERAALQQQIVLVAAAPFLLALIGSLLALGWGVRRGLRPLDRLRSELSCRDPDALAPVELDDVPSELRPAIQTLNDLLTRTGEAMAREQRFTSNAAHELRTPLTAIKTHMELAQRLPAGKADEAFANARAGIDRLQRTLEQLLMLARIEGDESWQQVRPARADAIVRAATADLADAERVAITVHDGSPAVAAPQELAAAALRNLLENALRHTPASQSVELDIGASTHAVEFSVRDAGDWPAGHDPELLTQRFWRRGKGGRSGLGLAIVNAIAARFGSIYFQTRSTGGLVARLRLERAAQPCDTPNSQPESR